MAQQPDPTEFEIRVPPELEAGVYANFLAVWHTAYEFTIDFAVSQSPVSDESGVKVPCRVVSRVKIPVTLIFDVLRVLNTNMTKYEEVFGEITGPEVQDGSGEANDSQ